MKVVVRLMNETHLAETHLITRLETPLISSVSARQYYLAKKDVDIIESLLN